MSISCISYTAQKQHSYTGLSLQQCLLLGLAHRRVLLSDGRWVELLKRWVSGGMHVLRRHHMAAHGAAGFYQAPIPTPTPGPDDHHREGTGSAVRSTPVQYTGSTGGSRAPGSTSTAPRTGPAASNASRHGPARTSGATGSGATSPSNMTGGGGSTTVNTAGQFPGPVAIAGEGAEGAAGPHYTRATGVAAARQVRTGSTKINDQSLWS
jgi:hypothetical protein